MTAPGNDVPDADRAEQEAPLDPPVPVRKPIVMAGSRPSLSAAAATRRLARTARLMPR